MREAAARVCKDAGSTPSGEPKTAVTLWLHPGDGRRLKATLHRLYSHRGSGRIPCEREVASVTSFLKGNREILDRGAGGSRLHLHAREIFFLTRIVRAPLAGLLADDECPLVLSGKGEERVAPRRNTRAADHDVPGGDEGGGFIRAGTPHCAILHDVREYIAAPFARAGIVDGDCFPAGKLALCCSGRTGPLGFVLLSEQGASGSGK